MSSCPARIEWVRFADGEATRNEETRLVAHARSCAACQREQAAIERLRRDLRRPIATTPSAAEIEALWARAERTRRTALTPRRPPWRTRRYAFASLAVASAAAVVAVVVMGLRSPEFTARGSGRATSGLGHRVGVEVWRRGSARPLATGAVLEREVALMLSYRNLEDAPVHLLAFAIDALGEVHWLVPLYMSASENPKALLLEARPKELHGVLHGEGVTWSELPPGKLRLVSLISRAQHAVSDIESLPAEGRTLDALRRHFPDAQIDELRLTVE